MLGWKKKGERGAGSGIVRNLRNNKRYPLPSTLYPFLLLFLLLSCTRTTTDKTSTTVRTARPSAILQTGNNPLWFLLTENGIDHLESVEDAVNTCAFVPWPLALHVRFERKFQSSSDYTEQLVLVVNRYGFIKLSALDKEESIAVYEFNCANFWKQYTVGGFTGNEALLYLDERFLDSASLPPDPRIWTFNMESNNPFASGIFALDLYPASEGWNVDTLRLGSDGLWYYRVSRKNPQQEVYMLRTENLAQAGIVISADDFFSTAPKVSEVDISPFPVLPEGFVYTFASDIGGSAFAIWEEQEDFNIGACGFVLVK